MSSRGRLGVASDAAAAVVFRGTSRQAGCCPWIETEGVPAHRLGWLCKFNPSRSTRALATIVSSLDECVEMIDRSFLGPSFKSAYRDLLRERARVLAG